MRMNELKLVEVEFIPDKIELGNIYVSEEYNVSKHLCPCGCGNEVVLTLIKSIGWTHKIEEGRFTCSPSVGSYNLACKSHYYIRNNKVLWL